MRGAALSVCASARRVDVGRSRKRAESAAERRGGRRARSWRRGHSGLEISILTGGRERSGAKLERRRRCQQGSGIRDKRASAETRARKLIGGRPGCSCCEPSQMSAQVAALGAKCNVQCVMCDVRCGRNRRAARVSAGHLPCAARQDGPRRAGGRTGARTR